MGGCKYCLEHWQIFMHMCACHTSSAHVPQVLSSLDSLGCTKGGGGEKLEIHFDVKNPFPELIIGQILSYNIAKFPLGSRRTSV